MRARLIGALLSVLASVDADAGSVQSEQRWAWSPNAGWVDALPLDENGPGLHVSKDMITGWLYSANVGWISANCLNTESCADVSYGLQLQDISEQPELLRLVGYMWSANTGWIVAHCATTNSCGETDFGLHVDRSSGLIDGFAWSESLGWISFSCANTGTCVQVSYGVGLVPQSLSAVPLFADGFES